MLAISSFPSMEMGRGATCLSRDVFKNFYVGKLLAAPPFKGSKEA